MTAPRPTTAAVAPKRSDRSAGGTLSLAETARRLGIARNTMYRLAAAGAPPFKPARHPWEWIPLHPFGRQRRTLVAEVDRYLAGTTTERSARAARPRARAS